MKIISNNEFEEFFDKQELDIRRNNNGRWIDQKCTPDVVSVIADFIITYLIEDVDDLSCKFTSKEIWFSDKAKKVIEKLFKKPNVSEKTVEREYDKLFGQPMKLLATAGILKEYSRAGHRRAHLYEVVELDILEYISYREQNSLRFLVHYINSTLNQSGIYEKFEEFFDKQTPEAYNILKIKYRDFIKNNTNIKGSLEINRIFTKVINPLAFKLNKKGTKSGRISKHSISYDMLMYNRDNFIDIYNEKPKNMSREEYMKQENINYNTDLTDYQMGKAKKIIKNYNDKFRNSLSEHYEESEKNSRAVHIHHIFPKNEFIEIAAYIENLICLTPNQHLLKAHPNGNTSYIDRGYQYLLLLSKMHIINENLRSDNIIYSIEDFKYVLSVGLDNELFIEIDNDCAIIKSAIDYEYLN